MHNAVYNNYGMLIMISNNARNNNIMENPLLNGNSIIMNLAIE